MKLGKTVTCPGLKGMSLWGATLCSVPVTSGFGGRAGREVSGDCFSSHSVLAATALVGSKAGARGLEPEPGASQGFSSAQG